MKKNKNLLFSAEYHSFLKKQVVNHHKFLFEEIKSATSDLKGPFKSHFEKILKDSNLGNYSPLKFYWLSLFEDFFYLENLHLDPDTNFEEIFSYWEKSEFCKNLISSLKRGTPFLDCSKSLLKKLANQIISFYYLHLGKNETPLLKYYPISEIGDFSGRIYLSDKHNYVDIQKTAKKPLSLKRNDSKIVFKKNKLPIKKGNFLIYGKKLFLIPTSNEGLKKQNDFKRKIEKSLNLIKKYSPESFQTFKDFTHTILPINESGIVSYSLQNLPGYSLINLFERDSIDLLDDLLHENGHHYLNTFLNFTDLINEDDDKIYYSPWRKALRPIRGIYHACFTFFWAFHLFGNLYKNQNKIKIFSPEERRKVTLRFLEEYLMLEYCHSDLKHAFKNKKITKDGWHLISQIYSELKKFKVELDRASTFIGNDPKLHELKIELVKKRKIYSLE